MLRFIALALLAMMVFAVPNAGAAPIIVDDFSLGNQQVIGFTPGGPSLTGSFTAVPGVGDLGATRNLSYTGTNSSTGNTWNDDESLRLNSSGSSSGRLRMATFDSAVQVNLTYDNFGTLDLTGFGSLDLIFNTVFDVGTNPTFDIDLILTDSSSQTKSGLVSAPTGFVPSGGTLSIPLSSLTGSGDLGAITKIEIRLNDNGSPSSSADFALDQVQFSQVPEPATLALWGVVGVAGAWYGRRRLMKPTDAVEA